MKTGTLDWRQLMVDFRLFGILLLMMVGLSLISDRFLTVDNLTNVLWSVCLIGIMTTGAKELSAEAIASWMTMGVSLSRAS